MKHWIIILSFLVLIVNSGFSQDVLLMEPVELNSFFKETRDAYSVVDKEINSILLFLMDRKNIHIREIDSSFNVVKNTIVNRPPKNFKLLLGHEKKENRVNLYFSNEKKSCFYMVSIELETGRSFGVEIPVHFKKEKFLETVSPNNKFYLLTVKKKSSIVVVYEIENGGIVNRNECDLSKLDFKNVADPDLYWWLKSTTSPFESSLNITKITVDSPVPIDVVARITKLYCFDNKLVLTLDLDLDKTQIATINLTDFTTSVKYVDQVKLEDGRYRQKCNSFLLHDKLYQLKVDANSLGINIYDLAKDSVIANLHGKKDGEIAFKNSSFSQKGTLLFGGDDETSFDKTAKFLHKMMSSYRVGIAVSQRNGNYEMTIGAVTNIGHSGPTGGMVMVFPGISHATPHGTITIAPIYHYNPNMYSYRSYEVSRAIYFKSKLNSTFEHIKGEIAPNSIEKMMEFTKARKDPFTNENKAIAETIFKINDYYVYGYYVNVEKQYYLRRFED